MQTHWEHISGTCCICKEYQDATLWHGIQFIKTKQQEYKLCSSCYNKLRPLMNSIISEKYEDLAVREAIEILCGLEQ